LYIYILQKEVHFVIIHHILNTLKKEEFKIYCVYYNDYK